MLQIFQSLFSAPFYLYCVRARACVFVCEGEMTELSSPLRSKSAAHNCRLFFFLLHPVESAVCWTDKSPVFTCQSPPPPVPRPCGSPPPPSARVQPRPRVRRASGPSVARRPRRHRHMAKSFRWFRVQSSKKVAEKSLNFFGCEFLLIGCSSDLPLVHE